MSAKNFEDWLAESLSGSIANLGYVVGMGIAPHPKDCRNAADAICTLIEERVGPPNRAIACVNACEGISNEALDAGVIARMVDVVREAEWAFEGILDTEEIEHDECAATHGFDLCGARPCQESGCIVDKLRRTKAALALINGQTA